MRGIIFLLILTIVESERNLAPRFDERKTYVYQYEGIILTGLPENGLNQAGLKITCGVQISRLTQRIHLLNITDPQIQELNGVWPNVPLSAANKLTESLAADLTKPVKFEYSNGRVGNINAAEGLPENILNIHKGILNMLQITIKNTQNVYELQETGIEGICHTKYILQENRKANHIFVTKSKDLDNCQERALKQIGMAYTMPCPTCLQRSKNLRSMATFTYTLKPKESGALIVQIESREIHQFTPFHELDGTAVMEAKQHFTLNDIIAAKVSEPQVDFQSYGTLKHHWDSDILQKPIQLIKYQTLETQVIETLNHLALNNQERLHSDAPNQFLQLVQLLRTASDKIIDSVWKNYATKRVYRHWILDALPAVGTADALRFLKHKIQYSEMKATEVAQALILAMQQLKADRQSVSVAKELLSVAHVQHSSILRQIVILGYGSVVMRYCAVHQTCPSDALQPLHNLLIEADHHSHEHDIVLSLRAIGNAGQPSSIKYIKKYLLDFGSAATHLPLNIQVDAVSTLRNIAMKDPRKVQDITVKIFMNRKNHPEVRIMACAVLFSTKPSLTLVTAVADSLLKETSLQVASFTYSYMRALSRSSLPSARSLAASCNLVIKLLSSRLDKLGSRYSRVFRMDMFRYNLMTGASAEMLLINNAGNAIPSAILGKIHGYALGSSVNLVEVGLRAEGLQGALLRNRVTLSGKPNIEKIQRILKMLAGWKALPEEVPLVSAYIRLLGQEIAFVEFKKDDIREATQTDTHGSKALTGLRKFVDRLRNQIGLHVSVALLAAEIRHVIATSVGLPMELSFHSSVVTVATANVQARISPSYISSIFQLLNANIQLKTTINPSVVIYTKAFMGIIAPFIQAGVELQAKVCMDHPVNVAVRINLKERNLKIESKPAQKENRIISFKSQVYAVSRNIENLAATKMTPILPANTNTSQAFVSSERSSRKSRQTTAQWSSEIISEETEQRKRSQVARTSTYKICSRISELGIEFCLDASIEDAVCIRPSPLYTMIGEHAVTILVRPVHSESEVETIVLEIQTGSKAASKVIRLMQWENQQTRSSTRMSMRSFPGGNPSSGTQRRHSSSSSSSSILRLSRQGELIRSTGSPILTILLRAVRIDRKQQGYQITGFTEVSDHQPRVHLRMVELAEDSRWKICADGIMPHGHKAMVLLRWGQNCQDYEVSVKASIGEFSSHPAIKVKLQWSRIPDWLKSSGRMVGEALPGIAYLSGMSQRYQSNPSRQITMLVILKTPQSIDSVIKVPKMTVYYQGAQFPLSIPISAVSPWIKARGFRSVMEIPDLLLTVNQRKCTAEQNKVLSFDNAQLEYQIPNNCYYVLTQDCSSAPKFVLLMKRAKIQSKKSIKLLMSNPNLVIEAYPESQDIKLLIDNVECPVSSLPRTEQGIVQIRTNGTGIILEAKHIQLDLLYFDGVKVQVVVNQMNKQTCGICGHNDGERKMIMPNHNQTQSVDIFFQSWLCSGTTCQDECKVQSAFVELESPLRFGGRESRCSPIEPVQRCLPGCPPTEKVPVSVAFHCEPTDTYMSQLLSFDLHHSVDSHSDCAEA